MGHRSHIPLVCQRDILVERRCLAADGVGAAERQEYGGGTPGVAAYFEDWYSQGLQVSRTKSTLLTEMFTFWMIACTRDRKKTGAI